MAYRYGKQGKQVMTSGAMRRGEALLDYGNWIRKKKLIILGLCSAVAGALIFLPFGLPYRALITVIFMIMLASFLFPLYSYAMFSQKGGRFQEKLYDLIIRSLRTKAGGRILDIGTGNGVLAIKAAEHFSGASVSGVDLWDKDWEYSKRACEKNAAAAKVENRVNFQKGDASALEADTGYYDGVVSNLTFHEVHSVKDKKLALQEALRVLKPGGGFAFIDYFYNEKYYGKTSELEAFLKGMKLSRYELNQLRDKIALPIILRHPRILGKAGLVCGSKQAGCSKDELKADPGRNL